MTIFYKKYSTISINLLLFVAVSFFCVLTTNAQIITDTLPEFNKIGFQEKLKLKNKNVFFAGQKIINIDSTLLQQYQLQSMSNMLSQQVPVFVKSYGFNSLATINFRGSSAAQSQVLWNGVPIQNAALGIADVSTLPVFFADNISIIYGGAGALLGSGNVGGALIIENTVPIFDTLLKSVSVNFGFGSFQQYIGGIKTNIIHKNWNFSTNFFTQSGINNFQFINNQNQKQIINNNKLQSIALTANVSYKFTENNIFSFSAWVQQYNRQIPPALSENFSDKNQKDASIKLVAKWDSKYWYAKTSFIKDEIKYDDDTILLHTNNFVYQYFQEIGWQRRSEKLGTLLIFSPFQVSYMYLPNTNELKQQSKIAVCAAWEKKILNDNADFILNTRAEQINNQNIFLPGASITYKIHKWLLLKANTQYTYRVPTLNELYYFPGGNIALKPEKGLCEDLGYNVKLDKHKIKLFHDVSLFNRNINDWIVWLGGVIWTPHNIAEVQSKGIETENKIEFELGICKFHLGLNTSYILATTVKSNLPNDGSIDKQIPYTPRYAWHLNAGLTIKKFYFNYNHTYTGYRFITADDSYYLLPYQTGNIQIMYSTYFIHHTILFTSQCNNIWNEHYEVVAQRPMPGVNFLLGIKCNIL